MSSPAIHDGQTVLSINYPTSIVHCEHASRDFERGANPFFRTLCSESTSMHVFTVDDDSMRQNVWSMHTWTLSHALSESLSTALDVDEAFWFAPDTVVQHKRMTFLILLRLLCLHTRRGIFHIIDNRENYACGLLMIQQYIKFEPTSVEMQQTRQL